MIAMNGLATLAFIFCYHPPTFHAKHGARSKIEFIKHFDYIGTFVIIFREKTMLPTPYDIHDPP